MGMSVLSGIDGKVKLGRGRALCPEGVQDPPLLPGDHHLPAEPLQVSPGLEPGESGTHAELLKSSPYYAELAALAFDTQRKAG